MKYAVIDTNVLVSSQMTHHEDSATRRTLRLILNGDVTPVISPAILAEYHEVLSRPKLHIRQETAEMVIAHFIKYGKTVTPVAYAKPLPDEKDSPFSKGPWTGFPFPPTSAAARRENAALMPRATIASRE